MIFRPRHNGDGPAADFCDWARAIAGKRGMIFSTPMYDTSFFMTFLAQHNGDTHAADFDDWARATAGKSGTNYWTSMGLKG